MIYDIRNEEKAISTLQRLTGVPEYYWKFEQRMNVNRIDFSDADTDVDTIIRENGGHYPKLSELEVVLTHVTTSDNQCCNILKSGLVELKKVYCADESELREFLIKYGVQVDIEQRILHYGEKTYNISYGERPRFDPVAEAAWSVGRKCYYDFTVCGFLSMNPQQRYGGFVHYRPEILDDIDKLLHTSLSDEWRRTHQAYEIVFVVPEKDIIYWGWDDDSYDERVKSYLYEAYLCAIKGPSTKEILCKNDVVIEPNQITECNNFLLWE